MFFLAVLLGVDVAKAAAPIDPQNRVYVGVSVVPSPAPFGFTAGFDSRLSRVIAIDVGGFASPAPLSAELGAGDAPREAGFALRHGLYFLPGLRIPHAQPRTWAFDFFVRAGGGAVWFADTNSDNSGFGGAHYLVLPAPGAMVGGDLQVRVKSFGVRASGRAVGFSVPGTTNAEASFVARSQWALSGFYQW